MIKCERYYVGDEGVIIDDRMVRNEWVERRSFHSTEPSVYTYRRIPLRWWVRFLQLWGYNEDHSLR